MTYYFVFGGVFMWKNGLFMTGCDDRFSVSLFMDGSVLYFAGKKNG